MSTSSTRPENHGRPRILIGLAAAGLLGAGAGHAASKNSRSTLPIDITSDNADFTQKTGVSTYTGNVHMTRGGLTLTGSKLVVTSIDQRSRLKAVLTGDPAHIDKQPDQSDNETVTGHARRIEYISGASTITLRGNAEVNRGGNQIRGAVITHNVDDGTTHAERGSNNRVHITLQPSGKRP